jgi:hypothetical protein
MGNWGPRFRFLEDMKGIIRLIQQLVYDEVKLSMSKMSIVVLMISLMFLGALFFVVGYLSALTSIGSEAGTPQASWKALSTHSEEAHHSSSQKQGHGFGGFFDRYADSQAQHGLSDFKNKESGIALMVPKSLQPFARYGVGQANIQTRKLANQVNPFANRKNSEVRAVPQYSSPPPQQYGQMQQQPMQPHYQQPSPYPYSQQGYPAPQQRYQQPSQYPYSQQEYPAPQQRYQQPSPYPYSQGYPSPQQYQPPLPYATQQGYPQQGMQ